MTEHIETQKFEPFPNEYVRPVAMIAVEIDSAVVGKMVSPGVHVTEGVGRYEVYETDLPALLALVADPKQDGDTVATDPERIDAAKARCDVDREEYLEKRKAEAQNPSLEWKDVGHEFDGPRNWVEQYARMFGTTTSSPAKGIPPFRRVTVIERDLPPPRSEAEKRAAIQSDAQTNALAEAIAGAMIKMQAMQPDPDNFEPKPRRGPKKT